MSTFDKQLTSRYSHAKRLAIALATKKCSSNIVRKESPMDIAKSMKVAVAGIVAAASLLSRFRLRSGIVQECIDEI